MTPQFIAIEGPTAVGKTTIAELLANQLAPLSTVGVHLTREPTRTPLGQLLRRQEPVLTGRALTLALAADRAAHVETEIIPQLDDGRHVVTVRYLASSLVLQRVDGIDIEEIWTYNQYVLPATVIYLEDHPDTLRERLGRLGAPSRLQLAATPERELHLYREARDFLNGQEWRQHTVDCANRTPEQVVRTIIGALTALAA
jgi:dTMP kinase